ncbi:MAG: ribose-5-phosphate isomerase RpiA [Pseudomonadota bacterium]
MSRQQSLKEQAAQAAYDYVESQLTKDSILGIGTGSTTNCFIDLLGDLVGQIAGTVSSSDASTKRLEQLGHTVFSLNEVSSVDFYIDGADEVDDHLNLLKGGGAALTREKIVASVSKEFICIVDDSKCSTHLGGFPLAVEVIPMARSAVARQLVALNCSPVYREGVVTDNGNIILDCYDFPIPQPFETEKLINNIPGVVCNGIFSQHAAHRLIVSSDNGIDVKQR